MFKKDLFVYIAEEHKGYYPNESGELKLVPSITQLIGIAYPMGFIPEENLKKASERGTAIHEKIEEINKCDNLEEMRNLAYGTENEDLINYTRLLKSFKLEPISCEERVYLVDENGNLICYGHYDMILRATEETLMTEKDAKIMFDLKTVANFEDDKVQFQTEIYRTAYRQQYGVDTLNNETGGIHLRDGKAKIHFFNNTRTDEQVIATCKALRLLWEKQ